MHNYTHFNQSRRRFAGLRSFLPVRITVPEDRLAVLAIDGRLTSVLPTGRHTVWPRRQTVLQMPALEQVFHIPGQEMLTADGAGVRATAVASVRITEPLTLMRLHANTWQEKLYLEVQLAVRSLVAGLTLDELLDQRAGLDRSLTPTLQGWAEGLGLEVIRVVVRDLVVPGALKHAVANVVTARLEGQAALERARGETAALRSLANAARMVESNPALLQLRLIQQMEGTNGNTYVLGGAAPTL